MFKLRNLKNTLEILSWLLPPYSWRAKQSFLAIPSLLRTFENHAFHPYYKIFSWKCHLCFFSRLAARRSEVCLPPPSPGFGCSATPTVHVSRFQRPCPRTPYTQFWLGLWLLFLSWNLFKGKIIYPVQVFFITSPTREVEKDVCICPSLPITWLHNCFHAGLQNNCSVFRNSGFKKNNSLP